MQRSLTLQNLAKLTGYSCQHLGAVERGQVVPSENVIVACDSSLLASGELEEAQRMAATALIVFAERGSAAGLHRVRGVRDAFREAGHHAAALALDEQARAVRVAARG